jgi:TM2 domain-containing membrane protein YozV
VQTTQTFQQPAAQQPVYTQQPVAVRQEKNAGVALILSFLFTGSGQVYNGEMGKGIGVLLGTIIGYMIFVIPGLLVFLYGLYDAYTTAQKMNKGEIPYKPTSMGAVIGFIVVEIILAIVFFLFLMAMIMGSSTPYYYY